MYSEVWLLSPNSSSLAQDEAFKQEDKIPRLWITGPSLHPVILNSVTFQVVSTLWPQLLACSSHVLSGSLSHWLSSKENRLWHSAQVCQGTPDALKGEKNPEAGFLLGHTGSQSFQPTSIQRCHHKQAGQEHYQEQGPCRPEATPAGTKNSIQAAVVSQSPQVLVAAERHWEEKHPFSLHQATLMPLDRKKQETCLLVEKGRKKRKWKKPPEATHII